jgi:hypothetical protein
MEKIMQRLLKFVKEFFMTDKKTCDVWSAAVAKPIEHNS